MPDPIPDVLVELLLLGELDDDEADAVRAQLVAEDDPRLAELQASNAELLERYPAQQVVSDLRRAGLDEPRSRWTWGAVAGLAAAAAAALLVWALGPSGAPEREPSRDVVAVADPARPEGDGIRDKGAARLIVQRRGDEDPLDPGATVRAGDVLQLSYSGASGHGVVVSLDGAGVATLHFPAEESDTTRLQKGLVRLDYAYELDDAPDFERFFFVTSSEPVPPRAVLDATETLGRGPSPRTAQLTLPEGWTQVSFVLEKRD